MSVVLLSPGRGDMLGEAGGLDVRGRGGADATGRGALVLGVGRGGFDDGRSAFGVEGRGGFELGAGRGGALVTFAGGALTGVVLAGFGEATGVDAAGAVLARGEGALLTRGGGVVLAAAGGVVFARAGGVVLATGAAGSSPQASSTSSSFSLIPSRL
ncbi:MAG TPA: hypothetical protein VMI54_16955 [Polyangiaceae bacterium]|nr:hypothetical protein [Polyangiaceae bacterium]